MNNYQILCHQKRVAPRTRTNEAWNTRNFATQFAGQ